MRKGGKPSLPKYSMWQPSKRNASTKSPMGRSCMRATPLSVKSPPITANAAVRGRIAVPALPMKNSMGAACCNCPPNPLMVTVVPASCTPHPSWRNATSMTRVSSESSKSWTTVVPWQSAESKRTRLEILLEPGRVIVPEALCNGGMSKNSVENIYASEAKFVASVACNFQALRTWLACAISD